MGDGGQRNGVQEMELPAGWEMWDAQPDGIVVLAYRPDIFDGDAFPPECLPTIVLKPERQRGPRGRPRPPDGASQWIVRLTLEPDVVVRSRTVADRVSGVEAMHAMAVRFTTGELPLEAAYPDPNEDYLSRLEAVRGGEA